MKKFVSACLMAGLLTCAAGAAQVGTINNNYPGDTEAQAQMLYDLGLFKGTDKGFALEKSMTRAEASVMLTRLLGAEKTALAGNWKHPFIDVPQWADKYVGWLYQNGLTKGVSATLYGSQRNVTCGQYCIFLTRAHLDADSYQGTAFVDNDEVRQTDEEGFIRGDAVSLSARLLSTNYAKNGDESDRSVAEKLIDDGVFTAEQFKNAAWDVLPRDYSNDYQYDGKWNLIASPFVCQIADVTVAQCPIDGVQPVSGTDRYAQSDMEQSDFILYRMDSKTMKLTQVLSLPQESSVEYLGRAGETDYLLVYDRKTETYSLCSVHGDTVKTELTLTEAQQQAARTVYQSARGCIICTDETTGYKLTETGVEPFNMAAGICRLTDNGMTVTQNCTADETVLTAYNWNGQKTDSYTISNAYQSDDAEVRKHCAPRIIGSDGALLWGTAGLYREENGRLVQVTDSPVISVKQDADGAYYAVSCDKSERLEYYAWAAAYQAGDRIIRIDSDDTVTTLVVLADTKIDELVSAQNGKVRFKAALPADGHGAGHFAYVLESGRVTVRSATDNIFYEYGTDAMQNEQTRIDKLLHQE
ncbi:S-layer homology domain-containing protein [Agathobaculum butyriciproducens]|uniref:S-layer homology domain-containing protein n=1 Tax=Agathobaculum butyriciproducens TaxID=1628085 RepID=UPI001D086DCD|nr:S-layer homology domain-containing protein [Agathobaculum butyriciproducens]MCQ5047657.1 S-layer homology domain-containing protein [Agathobaculum butyriciproducens]